MLQICNKSLEKRTLLDPLKIMSPNFKAQDRKKKHRLIHILCSSGKIIDENVGSKLENYLNKITFQHRISFASAVVFQQKNEVRNLFNQVYHAFDNVEYVMSIFLILA